MKSPNSSKWRAKNWKRKKRRAWRHYYVPTLCYGMGYEILRNTATIQFVTRRFTIHSKQNSRISMAIWHLESRNFRSEQLWPSKRTEREPIEKDGRRQKILKSQNTELTLCFSLGSNRKIVLHCKPNWVKSLVSVDIWHDVVWLLHIRIRYNIIPIAFSITMATFRKMQGYRGGRTGSCTNLPFSLHNCLR